MGYQEEMEHAGEVARQGANPVYSTKTIGVSIPSNKSIQDYLDTVNADGLVKDSALADGSINKIVASTVEATSNGQAQNFKVGDDAWIGDQNAVNTFVVSGVQNATAGFIRFGSGSLQPSFGHNGNGGFPAIGTPSAVTGSVLSRGAHLYFFNGTSSNNGWAQVI
jgi:hypothetical protein